MDPEALKGLSTLRCQMGPVRVLWVLYVSFLQTLLLKNVQQISLWLGSKSKSVWHDSLKIE